MRWTRRATLLRGWIGDISSVRKMWILTTFGILSLFGLFPLFCLLLLFKFTNYKEVKGRDSETAYTIYLHNLTSLKL
ncbi:hypothetical protein SDJN03_16156, partial [Cucurbita argyrosperma subsp. sororia]